MGEPTPRAYDVIQFLAGESQFRRRLAPHLRALPVDARVVDVGGGTGRSGRIVTTARYVCMDLDFPRLRRFREGDRNGMAVVADAARCPFRTETVDAVLCAKVVHHLDDGSLAAMLAESARILRPGGALILADAVRTTRWTSRVLWRFDRGSYPRGATEIRRVIAARYAIVTWEEFRLAAFHQFVLCVARKG